MYETRNWGSASILRTINLQGTDQGMAYVPPGIRTVEYPTPPGTVPTFYLQRDGILLQSYEVHNLSGGAATVGIGFRYGPSHWRVGRYDGTTYTDLTETAQARGAITVQVAGANQTGFVVLCDRPMSFVSATVTTAETDAGGATVPDHAVQHSDAAGTGWTAVTGITDNFTKTNAVWGAGLTEWVQQPPVTWGKITAITGLPAGFYALYFTSAHREANDVAAVITGIEVGILRVLGSLANGNVYADDRANWYEPAADGIVGYWSTANANNKMCFACRPAG